ncbi:MAG TPA: NAD(P)/FAD-dependent oxidoreductase [Syntrophomonas sp.]|nr:NAD(P)/FAD-dependent oxidoreductase [Syntrophomonas sp.]
MKAIVVGGGCAGLTAAHTLHRNGYDVTVYESAEQPGGRMTSYKKDGCTIDVAAQLVHPGYKMARKIMEELGILDQLIDFDMQGMKIYFNGDWIRPNPPQDDPEEIAKTMAWINYMGEENFMRFAGWVESRCKENMYEGSVEWMLDLDNEGNFADFVRREFGGKVYEGVAQPVLAAICITNPEDVGVGLGAQICWTVLCGEAAVLKYGIGSMADKIVEELGDKMITGTPVKSIVIKDNAVKGIETDQGFIEADTVVCATQANITRKIIPDLPKVIKNALDKVTYCRTIAALIFVDKEMKFNGQVGGILPGYTGSPFTSFLFQAASHSGVLIPEGKDCISAFLYGDGCDNYWNASDAEITDAVVRQLREVLPHMPKEILSSEIFKIPEAVYTMHAGAATIIKDMRDNHYKDVKGLYLCGEYMYTGSYESAISSGRKAAEVILGRSDAI